jgi:hypothetical protein
MFIIVSNIGFLLTERSSDSHISLQLLTLSQNRQSATNTGQRCRQNFTRRQERNPVSVIIFAINRNIN